LVVVVMGVPLLAGAADELLCSEAVFSLLLGWMIWRRSAPYLASIATESFCSSGDWLAKMFIWSEDRVSGSTPASFRSFLAMARRRAASSGETLKAITPELGAPLCCLCPPFDV